mmetsp:Transcript_7481/g.15386  ORF Transcript_7481/g.15386 Transcript_7481/m.15386 type:complete len:104 (-) Transcript_7481:139-450(-)
MGGGDGVIDILVGGEDDVADGVGGGWVDHREGLGGGGGGRSELAVDVVVYYSDFFAGGFAHNFDDYGSLVGLQRLFLLIGYLRSLWFSVSSCKNQLKVFYLVG